MGFFDRLYYEELSNKAKCVYMYLKDRAGLKGSCYPSLKTIAKDMKLSRSSVQRALRELEKKKYIVKEVQYRDNGSRKSNNYIVY